MRPGRLGVINAFGLRPHELDQATQGTPAKYTFCIAENEEESPWPGLHTEFGLAASDGAVTAIIIRSCVHIEARHTRVPEQLATDIAGTISRTGALIHETISAAVVLSPEHARLFASAGWSKSDIAQFMYDHAVRTGAELAAAGQEALSSRTRWRLPADHPDALPVAAVSDGAVRLLNSPAAVLVVVAGAGNAGVSAVVETFGPRGGPPAGPRSHPCSRPLSNRDLTCNFSVELRGFEPLTPSMRTRCATGLRYSPENLS